MQIKISTKEKFTVLEPQSKILTDTLAEEVNILCLNCLNNPVKNVIINLNKVEAIEVEAANNLSSIQQKFYEDNVSFIVCEMQKKVEDFFEQQELLEIMNTTPTESEAWDIVQMEEIERELMDDEGF
jgi:anti-anti-sigma factor